MNLIYTRIGFVKQNMLLCFAHSSEACASFRAASRAHFHLMNLDIQILVVTLHRGDKGVPNGTISLPERLLEISVRIL